jgi:hypothetical protein
LGPWQERLRDTAKDRWHVAISIIFEQYLIIMAHRVLAKAVGDSFDCRSAEYTLTGVVLPILPLFSHHTYNENQNGVFVLGQSAQGILPQTVLHRDFGLCWRDEVRWVSSSIAPSSSTATKQQVPLAALSVVSPSLNTPTICIPSSISPSLHREL